MHAGREQETKLHLALECLTRSGHLRLRVMGSSMLPAILPGSYVRIRRAAPAEMAPGDVVLARAADGVRLHRLVEIRGSGADTVWITRGDRHQHCDPPLQTGQLLGVLTHVESPGPLSWFNRVLAAGWRAVRIA